MSETKPTPEAMGNETAKVQEAKHLKDSELGSDPDSISSPPNAQRVAQAMPASSQDNIEVHEIKPLPRLY